MERDQETDTPATRAVTAEAAHTHALTTLSDQPGQETGENNQLEQVQLEQARVSHKLSVSSDPHLTLSFPRAGGFGFF